MNETPSRPGELGPDVAADDARLLSEDWITIWHSELAAIACDRELQESWQLSVAFWSATARGTWAAATGPIAADAGRDHARSSAGSAGADAATGTSTVAAAPDDGLDAVERLSRRVDGLERLLAEIERGRSGSGHSG